MTSGRPGVAVTDAGHFHRIGIATDESQDVAAWLRWLLGARDNATGMRQVHGLPFGSSGRPDGSDGSAESGARSEIVWVGPMPFCLLIATDPEGQLGRFVARRGTGLHSVAWTIEDMWKTEAALRQRGARITGVDIGGRHFFIHPADTAGLLIELTDTEFVDDPRDRAEPPVGGAAVVEGARVCWTTTVVADIDGAATTLSELLTAERVEEWPDENTESTRSLDLRIGDAVIRLASALGPDSRYAGIKPGIYSFCVGVPDLAAAERALSSAGIAIRDRDDQFLWTDPRHTCGLEIQWVQLI
jgi:hypothetical protein